MRDYQLVRNLVHRDRTIDVDVVLQTGVPGISQESDNVIFQFPETKEELFAYDVIVAFDPDWKKIRGETGQSLDLLSDWVFSQAGGLMLVAGIADIMIARHSPKPHAQTVHEFGGIPEILLDVGAIDSDVAGMDDEVGILLDDPPCERRPIGIEMRLTRTEMRVGNLNNSH